MPTLADLLRSFVNSPLSSPLSFSHSEPKKSKDKKTKNSQNQNSKLASFPRIQKKINPRVDPRFAL
ncbi:hypothetical protein BCR33DRAFT_715191, partial [Rhizoclosmatium globosum]